MNPLEACNELVLHAQALLAIASLALFMLAVIDLALITGGPQKSDDDDTPAY